jgi:hypothetical protein
MQDDQYAEIHRGCQPKDRTPAKMLAHRTGHRPGEQDAGEDARLQGTDDAAAVRRRAELRRQCNENLRHC